MKNIFSKTPTSATYIVGFGLSLLFTLLAFGLTELHVTSGHEMFTHQILLPVLIGLALLQMVVQLVFFLHLIHEDSPRWNLVFFVSTFGLVLLVVVASIWIMDHLNYSMKPESMTNYILQDEGVKPENSQMPNMQKEMNDATR
jgi:cytochrome o ubiquinol oxidase operon protein cyoD